MWSTRLWPAALAALCGAGGCQGPGGPLDGQTIGADTDPTGDADPSGDPSASATSAPDTATTGADGTADGSDGDTTDGDESTGSTGGDCGVPGAWCGPVPTCDAPLPNAGPELDWNETESTFVVASGANNHRGRDMFYNEGDPQWVLAKFAYGVTDWDLEGEQIDLFLLRECTGDWEGLGSVLTTFEGTHPTVEGVEDTGGRVYFEIPAGATLGPGRHRIHMVVRGDGTTNDVYVEVVPPGAPVFVADIDGTLTTYETEEFTALLTGAIPDVNPGAPEALAALVAAGYHPMYLTARPEFLGRRTREFLRMRGLPPGILHTTLNATGALGSAAVDYKTGELDALAARGLYPDYVFGNTDSDAEAYDHAAVQPLDHRIFFQFTDMFGGRTIDSYTELIAEFQALPTLCGQAC